MKAKCWKYGATTLSLATFSVITLRLKTIRIMVEYCYSGCHSVIYNPFMLSVVMLSVVMLSVMAPQLKPSVFVEVRVLGDGFKHLLFISFAFPLILYTLYSLVYHFHFLSHPVYQGRNYEK